MNLRKIKNEFKQEIYKEDLIPVIKNGLITMILYSVFAAALNYVLYLALNISTTYLIFLIGYFLARQIKSSHFKGHIVYQIISVVYLFIGIIIYNSISLFILFFEPSLILECIMYGFFNTLSIFNIFSFGNNIINNLLVLVIVLYTFVYTFTNSRNNM